MFVGPAFDDIFRMLINNVLLHVLDHWRVLFFVFLTEFGPILSLKFRSTSIKSIYLINLEFSLFLFNEYGQFCALLFISDVVVVDEFLLDQRFEFDLNVAINVLDVKNELGSRKDLF